MYKHNNQHVAIAALSWLAVSIVAPAAQASVYTLDVTTNSGAVLDLDITANAADSVLTPGFDITKVTGTVDGVSVSNYSGTWGGNGDQVSSGLYLDPYLNQNPPNIDSNGTNVFTVQNPPGSGGANFEIDNIYYAGTETTLNLSYQGGIVLLLNNGASYYLSANSSCSASGPGCSSGGYYDYLGSPTSVPGAVPELSTWAMMLIGFAGLGFAGYRRAKAAPSELAGA